MKTHFAPLPVILFCFFIFPHFHGWAEGTNEIMPSAANPTKLHLSKYKNVTNENYNDFALYRALENERLQFTVKDNTEIVYFGFQPKSSEVSTDFRFRIKNAAGVVVYPADGSDVQVPGSGPGWINGLPQAQYGPNTINPLGYEPFTFNPAEGGHYYLEFNFTGPDPSPDPPTTTGTSKTLECFDITVATAANVAIPGRVWSKAWQFTTDGTTNQSKAIMYPYTDDGITTQIDFNAISPYRFAVSCNKTGVYNSGVIEEDRKSVTGRHTYPQYRVFLHIPDHTIPDFPEGVLGELLSASASDINCNGTVKFAVFVNKDGSVKITLNFSGGYTTRSLPPTDVWASPATNLITWDGKDGSGTSVPNGTTISVSLQYVNGLTNLPMYDAEYMGGSYPTWNGYIIDLVSPAGSKPPVFWDDTKITGCTPPAGSNYTGCTDLSGCHSWNYCIGNANTINTWWYTLSNSTLDITPFNSVRTPGPLGDITGSTEACQGSSSVLFTVAPEINSTGYEWVLPSGASIASGGGTNSITVNFSGTATSGNIQVRGTNASGCAPGPYSTLAITVHPIPDLTTSLTQSVCSGITKNIALTSTYDPEVTYSWSVVSCSPEIVTCPPAGTFNTNPITVTPSVAGLTSGTITYNIMPSITTCQPDNPYTLLLTVSPLPDATTTPGPNSFLCSGQTTSIALSSTFATTTFSWNLPVCTNISPIPAGGGGSGISNQLTLTDNSLPGSADYAIIPNNGGCIGNAVHHIVTVRPTPVPLITGSMNFSVCQGAQEVYTTEAGMGSSYVWTVSSGGTINGGQGTNTLTVTWNAVGPQQVTVSYTNGNNCTAATPTIQAITVKPIPNVKTLPASTFTLCSGSSAQVALTSDVAGTELNTTFSWTASGNGATLTPNPGTLPATPGNINQAFTNSGNILEPVVFHIMPTAAGCSPSSPTNFTVNFNPVPAVSTLVQGSPSTTQSVCSGFATQAINLQTNVTGLTPAYNWTNTCDAGITNCPPASGTSNPIPAFIPGNTTTSVKNVTYSIIASLTATSGTCPGLPSPFTVHVNPLPVTTFTGTTTVCQEYPTKYLYPVQAGPACTYTWSIIPETAGTIDNTAAPVASITWNTPGNPTLQLNGLTTEGCTSFSSQVITVNPKPVVTLSACFDLVTTVNAKPFLLRGGTPLGSGGKYYIDGTTEVVGSVLNPSTLSATTHTVSFTYTDANTCTASDSKILTVGQSNANYTCYHNTFTDPRNTDPSTKNYPTTTVTANGRTTCWMLKNLNWGSNISSTQPQTDNCQLERYCAPNDNTCATYGSLFQWDELMQYGSTPGWTKGVCPPGWHVPTSVEWQDLIDASQGNGIAGGALKDLADTWGFKGLLSGILYFNDIWAFTATDNLKAAMYWTSTWATGKPIARGINFINPSVSYYESPKANAYPVRCVKD